ncbi:hypothetical protein [Intrasporangium sp. YIM S08009]|uniref:hypothetical protein n=1 Tax=Intrasporangium zincisolvens TaxID=3080018 RepID=UPI002B05A342|nr:hypothetical protein [Intrasporangium sp. YIM S08009]
MTEHTGRRDADAPAAPEHHETREDLETTMTTQQPDDPNIETSTDSASTVETSTDATSADRTERPDPTLSASLGWPDAMPVPQASTPDTTALPVSSTTTLPQASTPDTTALPVANTTTTLPQAAAPAGVPFRVEPSAPVPDDAVPASDPAQMPPPAWPPVGEPVAQTYQGPQGPGVTVRRGPRPGTVMFGLLAMIVAAYVLVANLTNADLSIRLVGPPLIGAFGGMLLLVGIAGVLAGRLRR